MMLDDLTRTLAEAVATGKAGTPVSLRLHMQLADAHADLFAALAAVVAMAEPLFSSQAARLSARENGGGRQLSVLLEFAGGESALLTLGRGCAKQASVQVTVLGNHGVVQLEGGELFDENSGLTTADGTVWRNAVEKSLSNGAAVALN